MPPEDVARVLAVAERREVEAGADIVREGQTALFKAFVETGAAKTFATDDRGKQTVLYFTFEGGWLGDIASYHGEHGSRVGVQAVEPSSLVVLHKDRFEPLAREVPSVRAWYERSGAQMYAHLFERLLEAKVRRAVDRYDRLLTEHPEVFERAPLADIASYLQIEPQSLSRLRRRKLSEPR